MNSGSYHASIVIVPDDQARYLTDRRFLSTAEGGVYLTLGAGPVDGRLVADRNREYDANLDISHELIRLDLGSRYEDEVIEALYSGMLFYRDDLDYDLFACPNQDAKWWRPDDGYNSNSFARGLLEAAGLAVPQPSASLPGFDKPIPPALFRPRR